MKEKTRFKLHKVKKQWVAIAVTSLALAAILSGAHLTQAEEQSGGTDSKSRLTATVQESSEQPITEAPAADSSVENNSANAVKSSETAEAAEVSDGGRASQTEAVTNQTNSEEHHPAEKATAVSGEAQSVQNAPSENAAQQETAKTEPATAAENNDAAPTNSFFEKDGKWYYKKADGQLATGWQTIDGKQLYFNQDGSQVKGEIHVETGDQIIYHPVFISDSPSVLEVNKIYYFDPDSGELWKDRFVYSSYADPLHYENIKHEGWFYLGEDGKAAIGWRTIGGKKYYFDTNGVQVKGKLISTDGNYNLISQKYGKKSFLDPDTGEAWTNRFVNAKYYFYNFAGYVSTTDWFYMGADGIGVTDWQKIDGMDYYFEPSSGIQVKGDIAERDGKVYYLDEDSGQVVKNRFGTTPAERISTVEARFPKTYYFGADGSRKDLTGWQIIDGKTYYFKDDHSIKAKSEYSQIGGSVPDDGFAEIDGDGYFFDTQGQFVTNRFVRKYDYSNIWYYYGSDGKRVSGWQTIDGKRYYFSQDEKTKGRQIKGQTITIDGKEYTFDKDSGEVINSN
ncbi:KxYKxGKxW signal peptide domain-containing protein [Streptococcus mutans]|uniref:glucan-binding protein GbpA n=1 Tax=Streptococcus mutans TaxID=1309 RepID=UPI000464C974|nr:KxYKxGKxW signal peptide domain-containing protein [Streptococcus mutans]MCB4938128.1 KxYKxGKxW signal peptide domain-containing protein [Streptococcus mutans]MCB4947186.1 KxYKxGKxW signal peptide domain-containing protein [Streptococcus mutans]MCB5042906.1 KxYKxGKxW signal peptide domain-containing protein [Streptococcus mutans]MCB5046457.1 KxYKxGKxW signal peptide domain-containing protein [Streptococcus mutans]MCB5059114.1 KxYKxGKxW signal peptide domain-containing protein [Streptococcus